MDSGSWQQQRFDIPKPGRPAINSVRGLGELLHGRGRIIGTVISGSSAIARSVPLPVTHLVTLSPSTGTLCAGFQVASAAGRAGAR